MKSLYSLFLILLLVTSCSDGVPEDLENLLNERAGGDLNVHLHDQVAYKGESYRISTYVELNDELHLFTQDAQWKSFNEEVLAIPYAYQGIIQFDALEVGTTSIQIAHLGKTKEAVIHVMEKEIDSIEIVPLPYTLVNGYSTILKAFLIYTDGVSKDITDQCNWSTSHPHILELSNDPQLPSKVTALQDGVSELTATFNSFSDTIVLEAVTANLSRIDLDLSQSLNLKDTIGFFKVWGIFSDNITRDISLDTTWSSNQPQICPFESPLSSGRCLFNSTGNQIISAQASSIQAVESLSIVEKEVTALDIIPTHSANHVGRIQTFKLIAEFSDLSVEDVTQYAEWESSHPQVILVNNASDAKGRARIMSVGNSTIKATFGNYYTTLPVTSTDSSLLNLIISSEETNIIKNIPHQLKATGYFEDGSIIDLTKEVIWKTDSIDARVSNRFEDAGKLISKSASAFNISATYNEFTQSSSQTCVDPILESISIQTDDNLQIVGNSGSLKAIAHYTGGITKDITKLATWSSSDLAIASIRNGNSLAGNISILSPGTITVQAIYNSVIGSYSITSLDLSSLDIQSTTDLIPLGLNQTFVAIATFSDTTTSDISELVDWSIENTSIGSINNTTGFKGILSTLTEGSTSLSATFGSFTSQKSFEVIAPVLTAINISSLNSNIALGLSQTYQAIGTYSDGSTTDLTNSVTWASSDSSVCTINAAGTITSLSQGATTISATLGSVVGSSALTIAAPILQSIAVSATQSSLALGLSQTYQAIGTYSDGSTTDLTNSVTWASSDSSISTIDSSGSITSLSQGSTTISATLGTVVGSSALTVAAPILQSIAISAAQSSLALGLSQTYQAIGTYSDGSTTDLTNSVTWASSDSSVCRINAAGTITSLSQGSTTISATLGSVVGSSALTIAAPILQSLAISSSQSSPALGLSQTYQAIGTYSDGSTTNLTNSVTWASSDSSVSTIDSSGTITSFSQGSTTISATLGSVIGSSALTIAAPILQSIAVSATQNSLALGLSQTYQAIGTYSDGSTTDLTNSVTWASSDSSVCTINAAGTITSLSQGSTTISATLGSVVGSSALTIAAPILQSIAVSAAQSSLALGLSQTYQSIGTYSDGSTTDLTNSVTWASSDTSVSTIDSSGTITSLSQGATTISATLGSIVGSSVLTISAPLLVSISINPLNSSLSIGLTQQYTAIGTYTDGTNSDITANVTWSTSQPILATINNSGLLSGLNLGLVSITAEINGISATTILSLSL